MNINTLHILWSSYAFRHSRIYIYWFEIYVKDQTFYELQKLTNKSNKQKMFVLFKRHNQRIKY